MPNDKGAGLFFFFAGIYGLTFSYRLPMGTYNAPGAGVFPFTLSALLVVSGIAWFIHGLRSAKDKTPVKEQAAVANNRSTPLKIIGLTALFVFFFKWLGYPLGASLYIFALLFFVSRYRIIVSIPLAVVIGLGSWYLFEKTLSVQLPNGLFPF